MRGGRRTIRRGRRRGVTLLELLIVMVILLMITAAAIPIVVPATRNRQMREATRLVTTYLGAAKARAVQTGRPAGVMIERFNGNAFALQMSQVEVPPPYAGDIQRTQQTSGALPDKGQRDECNEQRRGTSSHHDSGPNSTGIRNGFNVTMAGVMGTTKQMGDGRLLTISTHFDLQGSAFTNTYTSGGTFSIECWPCVLQLGAADTQWQSLLRYGDQVRLDYRGLLYTLTSVPTPLPATAIPWKWQTIKQPPPGNRHRRELVSGGNGWQATVDANLLSKSLTGLSPAGAHNHAATVVAGWHRGRPGYFGRWNRRKFHPCSYSRR